MRACAAFGIISTKRRPIWPISGGRGVGKHASLGQLQPFVRAASKGEIAAQSLPAMEAIPVNATTSHQRKRLSNDHLSARLP